MNFHELLKYLCKKLNCTQNELSACSGLSPSVISRYMSGERTPSANSIQLNSLAKGLSQIAKDKEFDSVEYEYSQILSFLTDALHSKNEQFSVFLKNFNALIDQLDIKIKDLATGINFDVSFLYRVRSGERHPSDIYSFCNLIAFYVADRYTSESDIDKAASLLCCKSKDLSTRDSYYRMVLDFLCNSSSIAEPQTTVTDFLYKMDDFNLDDYIESIHFNDIKIPTTPLQLPVSRYYYGIDEMRKAELDFFKTTVLSKSKEPVFMYSDMPMADMAEDMDFNKKWMFGIAATLKKGLHINIIHNLDRPFEEIMLGLEAWIPIYMTGQVSPYHLEGYKNDVFHQLNYCSGSAALFGECIDKYHSNGRYYLTNHKQDIAYYNAKADNLLKHAKPLMDIYNVSTASRYWDFLTKSMSDVNTDRHIIAPGLPLFTMPESMLQDAISFLTADVQKNIQDYYHLLRNQITDILHLNRIDYDCHILTEEEFKSQTPYISIPDLFVLPIRKYTYEEYKAHIFATQEYQKQNPAFVLNDIRITTFKNIQITIIPNQYFVISKCKAPNIHFVIRHKKMLNAMENFYPIKQE